MFAHDLWSAAGDPALLSGERGVISLYYVAICCTIFISYITATTKADFFQSAEYWKRKHPGRGQTVCPRYRAGVRMSEWSGSQFGRHLDTAGRPPGLRAITVTIKPCSSRCTGNLSHHVSVLKVPGAGLPPYSGDSPTMYCLSRERIRS